MQFILDESVYNHNELKQKFKRFLRMVFGNQVEDSDSSSSEAEETAETAEADEQPGIVKVPKQFLSSYLRSQVEGKADLLPAEYQVKRNEECTFNFLDGILLLCKRGDDALDTLPSEYLDKLRSLFPFIAENKDRLSKEPQEDLTPFALVDLLPKTLIPDVLEALFKSGFTLDAGDDAPGYLVLIYQALDPSSYGNEESSDELLKRALMSLVSNGAKITDTFKEEAEDSSVVTEVMAECMINNIKQVLVDHADQGVASLGDILVDYIALLVQRQGELANELAAAKEENTQLSANMHRLQLRNVDLEAKQEVFLSNFAKP
jgi:hypothetical protein